MLPFSLSRSDADIVNMERKTEKSAIVRTRMLVLHLLDLGYKSGECALIAGCHANSVTNYVKMYNAGGLAQIRKLNYSKDKHQLRAQYKEVEQSIEKGHCHTVADAAEVLRKEFNYKSSLEAVRQLLHRLGFKRRKRGTFPGKIDDFDKWNAKQEVFVKKLYKLLKKAKKGVIDLVFSDAAHFVYGKFNNFSWSKKAQYAPSGHGRFRINVYGAYNPVCNGVYSMYNEGYINADLIVEYLNWLREEVYQDKTRSLHIVLDNARYQHCAYVKETAKQLNVELEFLPGYSPNLNLIERLWKYMKQILGQKYMDGKETFQKEVVDLLNSLGNKDHQKRLKTLMNFKFQRFDKSQILGC